MNEVKPPKDFETLLRLINTIEALKKKKTFCVLISLFLVFHCFKSSAQKDAVSIESSSSLFVHCTDTEYKYKHVFYQLAGLKDKSELIIQKSLTDSLNKFNVIGTTDWIREIYADESYSIKTDSVEYVPWHALLILMNKTDTIEEVLDNKFHLYVPHGNYKLSISEAGMGFIDRKIKIKKNELYSLNINLKTRRTIEKIEYKCKAKLSRKEIKSIKRHYKSPDKYELIKTNCDCNTIVTIYD